MIPVGDGLLTTLADCDSRAEESATRLPIPSMPTTCGSLRVPSTWDSYWSLRTVCSTACLDSSSHPESRLSAGVRNTLTTKSGDIVELGLWLAVVYPFVVGKTPDVCEEADVRQMATTASEPAFLGEAASSVRLR